MKHFWLWLSIAANALMMIAFWFEWYWVSGGILVAGILVALVRDIHTEIGLRKRGFKR